MPVLSLLVSLRLEPWLAHSGCSGHICQGAQWVLGAHFQAGASQRSRGFPVAVPWCQPPPRCRKWAFARQLSEEGWQGSRDSAFPLAAFLQVHVASLVSQAGPFWVMSDGNSLKHTLAKTRNGRTRGLRSRAVWVRSLAGHVLAGQPL